jgi:acyl carrier protein
MKTIENELKTIICHLFGIQGNQLHRKTRFKEDLGMDSLDSIEWIVELETRFKISISDEDALNFKEIGQVIDYLEQHIADASLEGNFVGQRSLQLSEHDSSCRK